MALYLSKQEHKKEKAAKRQKLEDSQAFKDGNGSASTSVISSEGLVWNKEACTKKTSFDASVFGNALQKGFSKLYNDPLFSDLTLLLGEERIRAHKVVPVC